MKQDWPLVNLGRALFNRSQFERIDEEREYTLCRVQTGAKGVVEREKKFGYDIKTKTQQFCKTGDFIVAELDAKFGGYGIIPDELNGAIVSSHYFLFEIDENLLNRKFLEYYSKTNWFFEQVKAQGSTNYSAVRPVQILDYKIPLPPLNEQNRIVGIIDSIKIKSEATVDIKQELLNTHSIFSYSYLEDIRRKYPANDLGKYLHPKEILVSIDPIKNYKQVTAKWWNNGVVLRKESLGSEMSSKQYLVNKDDFIISKIDARHGAYGIIPEDLDEAVVTGDFPVFEIKGINPDYIDFVTKSNYFLEECKKNSQGTTRRVRLNMDKFIEIKIPVPPLDVQDKVVELVSKVNKIEKQNAKLENELNELLPSVIDKAFKGEL
ncbi:MAG: hypothetical protein DAHOPDDO_00054 [Ignavibacteriaceae bacterium]|nr:hypothetical protein [Ignavibacteriaceae bacterium]